jgi:hypothetical protein
MKTQETNKKEFEKVFNGSQSYFAQSVEGTGEVRDSKKGKVNFNVTLKNGNLLNINREGVYNSNRYEICNNEVSSIDELISVVNEKCGL